MCYRNEYHFRCGHSRRTAVLHCTRASFNRATNRWNKCPQKTGIVAVPRDEICGRSFCCLTTYEGRWICCKCKYGYRPDEVNRNALCARGECYHRVYWECFARSEENIRMMYEEELEEEEVDEEEVEESINQDTSMDSIVFEPSEDEEDEEDE